MDEVNSETAPRVVDIDLRIYSLAAIKLAAYRVADRCTATIGSATNDVVSVTFSYRSGTPVPAADEAIRRFHEELLDQDLREQLRAETEPLRALILAHAFSRTDLVKRS